MPVGEVSNIAMAHDGAAGAHAQTMQFPYAVTISRGGERRILLSFNTNSDSLSAEETFHSLISADDGASWRALSAGVPFSSVYSDDTGRIAAFNLRTIPRTSDRERGVVLWESEDFGDSWRQQKGVLTAPFGMSAAYFHRAVVPSRNRGSLLATVYGRRVGDRRDETWLVRSADRGRTWAVESTIASVAEFDWSSSVTRREGFNEPSMARLPDGRLMAVVRQSAPVNPSVCRGKSEGLELITRVSTDDGRTWGDPDQLIPSDGTEYQSADPQLLVAGQEVLLASGRPRTTLLRLTPGTHPAEWNQVYDYSPPVTSGYTSVVRLGGRDFLQFGDYGSNWCFPVHGAPESVGIWMRRFTA
jgi:hypothetical protein